MEYGKAKWKQFSVVVASITFNLSLNYGRSNQLVSIDALQQIDVAKTSFEKEFRINTTI